MRPRAGIRTVGQGDRVANLARVSLDHTFQWSADLEACIWCPARLRCHSAPSAGAELAGAVHSI